MLLFVLASALLSAGGVEDTQLRRCAGETDDLRRLACFDKATDGLRKPRLLPPAASKKWKLSRSVSPMDDSATATASIRSEGAFSAWLKTPSKAALLIRCQERELEMYIATGTSAHVTSAGPGRVGTVRFDRDDPYEVGLTESTSSDALFFVDDTLLLRMMSAETFLFRFTPFNSAPATVQFDVRGGRPLINEVLAACGKRQPERGFATFEGVRTDDEQRQREVAPKELLTAAKELDELLWRDPREVMRLCNGRLLVRLQVSGEGNVVSWSLIEDTSHLAGAVDAVLAKVAVHRQSPPVKTLVAEFKVAGDPPCLP